MGLEENQAKSRCDHNRFGAALRVEFAEDSIDVEFDGMFADAKFARNLFVRFAFGEQAQDL